MWRAVVDIFLNFIMKVPERKKILSFRRTVFAHFKKSGRYDLAWRTDTRPYFIFISELMLQQTQVPRVQVKFAEFVKRFPDFRALAAASQTDVLAAWQGLGYNRRALFAKRAAEIVVRAHGGELPRDVAALQRLPGIGPNTAAAILVYAWDEPHIFLETNIRTVFLHEFFPRSQRVADARLLPFVAAALDQRRPREWYWALMDYGTFLKRTTGNASRRSKHHVKQTRFEGSHRQVRGGILKFFLSGTKGAAFSSEKIAHAISREPATTQRALDELYGEGFLEMKEGKYWLG